MKTLLTAAAMGLGLAMAAPAHADVITLGQGDVDSSFTLNYNGFDGSGAIDGLSGQVTLRLTQATDTSYTFAYTVDNTSADPILTSRISGFGFNTDPSISGASATGTYTVTATNANVPNIGTVDVCFKGGGGTNSCAGGGGGGVTLGDSGAGSLVLNFSSPISSLGLSDFFVRYQSITGTDPYTPGSAVGTGTLSTSTGGSTGGTPVPAPGILGLFAIALGLLGWRSDGRRTRSQGQPAFA